MTAGAPLAFAVILRPPFGRRIPRKPPADAAARTGLKFAPNWLGAPALVAPVRDLAGNLVAAHGRYLVVRDPKCRSEGEIGEGVFIAHPEALEGAVVTICEGVFDALSLSAAQLPSLALIGLAYRPWLAPPLKGRVVNLAFDADAAGDAAAREWEERLAPIKTRRVRPTRGKEWNEELLAGGL
ncbi:MAG: toprim domain-containing protein, partial [Armatimonadetes bacterium]|nr:toprim domain-containing protein [Armatimonadota bacterium]